MRAELKKQRAGWVLVITTENDAEKEILEREVKGKVFRCESSSVTLGSLEKRFALFRQPGPNITEWTEDVADAGRRHLDWLAADAIFKAPRPIPIRLPCPACHAYHIDEDEWATKPHRTHRCEYCNYEWRPANTPTVGVKSLED